MSLSDNYPDIRPQWMNDYANAGVIDPRCSFARSDSTPSNVHYWSNEDHLSSENILLQSQALNTTWAAVDIAAPTGGQTAPDGTSTAWLFTADSASSQTPYVRQSPTFIGSTQYTMVGHLKAGTASHGYISFRTQNGYSAYALLNFSGGTVSHAGFGDFTGVTSSVTALGSSWFKVTLTATTGTNLSGSNVVVGISDGTTPPGTGYATWNSAGETMYAWGVQLSTTNAKTYDSPTTTQIHREYAATLKSVAYSGQPRFEYEPTGNRSAKGLLIESQSQNLATYSSDFSNAAWSKTRTSVEASAAIGPDGTLSASLIRDEPSTNNTHHVYQLLPSIASGTVVTASVFAKAAGRTFLIIQNGSTTPFGGASYKVWFNLTSGAVGTISGSGVTASATDCGNGWTRCTVTFPASTATGTHALQINSSEGDNDQYHVGDSYFGVLLWGAQYEQSSFPSSYIATSGSASTRTRDSLSVATADIGYTGGPVSVVGEASMTSPSSNVGSQIVVTLGSENDNRLMLYNNGSTADTLFLSSDGSLTAFLSGSITTDEFFKFAMRLDTNSVGRSVNGGAVATDTSTQIPAKLDSLRIGTGVFSAQEINGHIKRVALYSEALTDTELQSLTS